MTRLLRWGRPASVALLGLHLWFALGAMALTFPSRGLDASWESLLGWAWVADLRWGVDFIDNFGPYGFLYPQQFLPETVAPILILNGLLAAVAVVAWLWLLRRQPLLLQILFCLLLALATSGRRDTYFMIFPALLAFGSLGTPPAPTPLRVVLVLAVALVGMVKWTFLVTGLGVLALLDAGAILGRRPPWRLPLAVAAMLVLHVAAGQALGDLPRFIAITWDQTASFAEAMANTGDATEIVVFDLIALAGVGLAVVALRQAGSPFRHAAPLLLSAAGIVFVLFKSGFVRHDWVHTTVAWGGLAVLLAGLALAVPGRRRIDARAGIAVLAFLALGVAQSRIFVSPQASLPGPAAALWKRPLGDAGRTLELLTDPSGWRAHLVARREAAEAAIRPVFPLPAVTGTIDTIPPYQADLLARHLDYRPHPTVQEHQAYTPATLAADEAFFRSDAAPDFLLFAPGSIDNRYPALTEGPLWPLFLARYVPETTIGAVTLMRRRTGAWSDLPLSAPALSAATMGAWVEVASAPGTATFARIEIEASWLGRLVGLMFQPAPLYLEVRLADGRTLGFRLPRGLASAGFVLSPYVPDVAAYVALAGGDDAALAPNQVEAFRIGVGFDRGAEVEEIFEVGLRQIDLSALDR